MLFSKTASDETRVSPNWVLTLMARQRPISLVVPERGTTDHFVACEESGSKKRAAFDFPSPQPAQKAIKLTEATIPVLNFDAVQMQLWDAIEENSISRVNDALRQGADLDKKICEEGSLPIFYAAISPSKIDVFKFLLKRSSYSVSSDDSFASVIAVIVSNENVEGLAAMLSNGFRFSEDPYWTASAYQSAVHRARSSERAQKMVELLNRAHN